jgi:hypothetical protein
METLIYTITVYYPPVSFSTFHYLELGGSVNIFRNPFLICYSDKQHPVRKSRCRSSYGSLLPLSSNPFCPCIVHPCVCVGVFTRTRSVFLSLLDSIRPWMPDRVPRLKGRKNLSLYSFFFKYLEVLIMNRYGLRLFLSYAIDCLCRFFRLSKGSLNSM